MLFFAFLLVGSSAFLTNVTEDKDFDCTFYTIRRRRAVEDFQIQFWRVNESNNSALTFSQITLVADITAGNFMGKMPQDTEFITEFEETMEEGYIRSRLNRAKSGAYVVCTKMPNFF